MLKFIIIENQVFIAFLQFFKFVKVLYVLLQEYLKYLYLVLFFVSTQIKTLVTL
jgi:hypothetical protein